jgi:hypothetical protein
MFNISLAGKPAPASPVDNGRALPRDWEAAGEFAGRGNKKISGHARRWSASGKAQSGNPIKMRGKTKKT